MNYKNTLFLFRRDLRVQDNTGLIAAHKHSESVFPAFCFDPVQCDASQNKYFSYVAFGFLCEALQDLSNTIDASGGHLSILRGKTIEVLQKTIKENSIDAIFVNSDYTPFSRKRDEAIKELCKALSISFHSFEDALLTIPGTVQTKSNTPYKVYSAFARQARTFAVPRPSSISTLNWSNMTLGNHTGLPADNEGASNPYARGNRAAAEERMQNIVYLDDYATERDIPSIDGTTGLSAYLKFGLVSPREVYHHTKDALGGDSILLNELYWRDFFYQVAWNFPFVFETAFLPQFSEIKWSDNSEHFEAWCTGNTGYPIVDAGMRQLNQTGYMHNRVRMIVASFLIKDLHINWQWGERYFAQKLIDYDPCINNGNWQWAASTGCDAQPYFRIFNPARQSARFDPDALYIKKWIPELSGIAPKSIHTWDGDLLTDYPAPIVVHKIEAQKAKEIYARAKEQYAQLSISS